MKRFLVTLGCVVVLLLALRGFIDVIQNGLWTPGDGWWPR